METALVVLAGNNLVKAQVARILHVDAVRAVSKGKTSKVPVLHALDVEHTTVPARHGSTDGRGGIRQTLAVDDDLLVLGGMQGDGSRGRTVDGDVDVLEEVVGAATEDDDVARLGDVDGGLDVGEGLGLGAVRGRYALRRNEDVGRLGQGEAGEYCWDDQHCEKKNAFCIYFEKECKSWVCGSHKRMWVRENGIINYFCHIAGRERAWRR